jgi:hypothetical protein
MSWLPEVGGSCLPSETSLFVEEGKVEALDGIRCLLELSKMTP